MKHAKIISLCTLFLSAQVLGEQKNIPAIVDFSRIVNPENPAASGALQWRDEVENFQKWLNDKQAPLKKEEDKITAYQQKLEKAGKQPTEAERNEYIGMVQSLQGKTQELSAQAQEKFKMLTDMIKQVIEDATRIVRKSLGFAYSMPREAVIECDPSMDITDGVVQEMNTKYEAKKRAEKMKQAPKAKL